MNYVKNDAKISQIKSSWSFLDIVLETWKKEIKCRILAKELLLFAGLNLSNTKVLPIYYFCRPKQGGDTSR